MSKYTKIIHASLVLIAILSVGGEGRSQAQDPVECASSFAECIDVCRFSSSSNCVSKCVESDSQCKRILDGASQMQGAM
jgi:hypothetical protein